MKKLLIGLFAAAVMSLSTGQAASTAYTTQVTTNYVLLSTGNYVLDYITLLPDGTNTTIRLYDFEWVSLALTNTGYTNTYVTNATVTTVFTNYSGIVERYTNSALSVGTRSVAANTDLLTPFATYIGLADVPTTFNVNQILTRGLCISNSHAMTVIAGYRQQ